MGTTKKTLSPASRAWLAAPVRKYQVATSSAETGSWVQCGCGAWVDVDAAMLTQDGVRCGVGCVGVAKLRSVA